MFVIKCFIKRLWLGEKLENRLNRIQGIRFQICEVMTLYCDRAGKNFSFIGGKFLTLYLELFLKLDEQEIRNSEINTSGYL